MNTSHRGRRAVRSGATLIEAIVAIAMIGLVGLSGVSVMRSAIGAMALATTAEREMRAADDFMGAVTLWSASELDQRLGEREQGEWRLEIQRIGRTLYSLTLRDAASQRVVLETAIYRPRGTDAAN